MIISRTPFKKTPKVNGKDVDLYKLYTLITTRGGWMQVSFHIFFNL